MQSTVFSILYKKLGVKKISARWVPGLLSIVNEHNHVIDFKAVLALLRPNSKEFLSRYITGKTLIHYYSRDKIIFKNSGLLRTNRL